MGLEQFLEYVGSFDQLIDLSTGHIADLELIAHCGPPHGLTDFLVQRL